jgi:hypothetical protein
MYSSPNALRSGSTRINARLSVLLLLSTLISCAAISAWAGEGGEISGTVKDASGSVIPKAAVTAVSRGTGFEQTITTDDKGFYSFPSLPVARYDLEFKAAGFGTYRRNFTHRGTQRSGDRNRHSSPRGDFQHADG